ncbi:MAG: lytic transglycosylase domain-containing protein [Terracidiphilus sp.]
MRARILIALGALAGLAACLPAARAAERVTLRNGFAVDCNHHAQIEGRVRLFLTTGEDNYIEFAPEEIATVDHVADPPAPTESAKPSPIISSISTSDAKLSPADLNQMLAKAGSAHNLDEDLLASVVKAESGGNTRAVSRTGARGLMQLMPGTATQLGVKDSFAPDQNVQGGTAYLDALLTRYHDNIALALAAYNAGPLAVDRYHGIPPYRETQAYVARVIHEFNRLVRARQAQARRQAVAAAFPSPAQPTP